MTLTEFVSELRGKRVESELIKSAVLTAVITFTIIGAAYALLWANAQFQKALFFLIFAALSYTLVMPIIRQARAYRQFPCMSGMMIGMTTGMLAGFLPGFYVAATNGMFIGSVFGMAVGIALGILNGSLCGVMGFLEGTMSGFMGGLMGAMTAFMLFNDHLKETSLIVFGVCAIIGIGLNYMIFEETKKEDRQRSESWVITAVIAAALMVITIWVVVYGPRSWIFS